ncbi:MAG TPA: PAS domain S-box protein [Victivallales bacterium]|nr:PAS domain S-box protein [Victivallales bacterium]
MKIYFDRINKYRNDCGISVKGFGKLLEVSRTTLWKWEKGQLIPSENTVKKIANILNVSVSDISDMPEPVQVSQHSFSGVVDSWLGLTEINDEAHQKQIALVMDTIKNLNNKLNQSVLIIKALLDSMETMFYIKDSRLKYLTANASFLKNVSYDPELPVLGKDDYMFFSNEEARKNTEEDRKIFQTGQSILRNERIIPGCRKTKWGIVSKLPVFDSEHRIVGVIGTFIDITERKKSEEIREMLQKSIEEVSIGVSIIDAVTDEFLYISKSPEMLAEDYGYPKEKFINKVKNFFINTMIHPDDRYMHTQHKGSYTRNFRYRIIKGNGEIMWQESFDSEITFNNKKGILWIWRDVTEIVKEEEMRKLLKKCVEEISLGLSIFDPVQSKFLYMSKSPEAIEKEFGYSRKEFIGREREFFINKVVHPDDRSLVQDGERTRNYRYRIIRADGEIRWYETFDSEVTFNNRKGTLGIGRDITDVVESEEKIRLLEACLDSTGNMVTVTDDVARKFIYFSKTTFKAMSGYPIEEINEIDNVETFLSKYCHPDDLHKHYFEINPLETDTHEWRMICADGRIKWIRTTVSQLRDSSGVVLYTLSSSIDVSKSYKYKEKKIYKLLKEEFKELSPSILWSLKLDKKSDIHFYNHEQIGNNFNDLEDYLDSKGQFISVFDQFTRKHIHLSKKSFLRISGYSRENKPDVYHWSSGKERHHPDDRMNLFVCATWPDTYTYKWRMICSNGKIKRIITTKSSIRDKHSNLLYVISASSEISAFSDNQYLKLHDELFETTLDAAIDWNASKEDIVLNYLSDEIELITGYPKQEFINGTRSLQAILHPDSQGTFESILKSEKIPDSFEFKFVTSDNKTVNMKTSILSKKSPEDETVYYGKAILL